MVLRQSDYPPNGTTGDRTGSFSAAGSPRLRLIAHPAGSVKRLLPANVVERGIVICHAAGVIADAVAEYTILVILLGLRRVHLMDRVLKYRIAPETYSLLA